MNIRDRRGLKAAASEALSHAPNHRHQILIWAGISTALSFLVAVLNFLLDSQIAATGGLSGIGLRSVLSTLQSGLSLGVTILLPFWNIGYTASVLRLSRKVPVSPDTLLEGFRRFGSVLRLTLVTIVIHVAVITACFYGGSLLFSFTPWAAPIYEVIAQNSDMLLSGIMDEASLYTIMEAMIPMFLCCTVLYLIVVVPIVYRMRLTQFFIVDIPGCGALQALRESLQLMKHNCMKLFLLDLSFWWYFAAQLFLAVFSYGDLILPLLGVALPITGETAYFMFYILSMLAQLLLLYCFGNKINTTYAKFYDTLRTLPGESISTIP